MLYGYVYVCETKHLRGVKWARHAKYAEQKGSSSYQIAANYFRQNINNACIS